MSEQENTPPIGHNTGQIPTPEIIAEMLAEDNKDLMKRREELLASTARMPATVDNEETAAKFVDMRRLWKALESVAEDRRSEAKAPYWDGGKAVDGFFATIKDVVAAEVKKIDNAQTKYMREKADKERREREAEARKAQEAAEAAAKRAADEAAKADDEKGIAEAEKAQEEAMAAHEEALRATDKAGGSAADLSRVRGTYGSTSSLRTVWTFRDLDREKLDLQKLRPYLPLDALEKAMRAYIKAGGREIAGAEIFQDYQAR